MNAPYPPDCYWVEPGRLLAGAYPGGDNAGETRTILGALLDVGIRTFIDLTEPPERVRYNDLLSEEADARGVRATHTRVPIRDHGVPTVDEMRTILALVDEGVSGNAPVYVHCWGGIGRTGTAVGCWLTTRGAAGDDVVATIAELRCRCMNAHWESPETDGQVTFVRRWRERGGGRSEP